MRRASHPFSVGDLTALLAEANRKPRLRAECGLWRARGLRSVCACCGAWCDEAGLRATLPEQCLNFRLWLVSRGGGGFAFRGLAMTGRGHDGGLQCSRSCLWQEHTQLGVLRKGGKSPCNQECFSAVLLAQSIDAPRPIVVRTQMKLRSSSSVEICILAGGLSRADATNPA